ncbi:hypothetical protein [Rhizorhabdus dicambivorans]|uniref:hypothetical protein n=1 Tax=Rhizorhabdus dicambivorans TaxID=1850238 RepID=UPI001596CB39|nr:hypothetical protein [Rhizorhabdus dicambivorans]
MLMQTTHQVTGDADVDRAMSSAGKDMDAGLSFDGRPLRQWMLNQVQHDGFGSGIKGI